MPVGRLVAGEGYRAGIGKVSVEQLSDSTLERSEFHGYWELAREDLNAVGIAEVSVSGVLMSRPVLAGTLLDGLSVKMLNSSLDS